MLTVRRLLALGVVATTAAYVGLVAPNASATDPVVGFPGGSVDNGRIELTSTANSLIVTWYNSAGGLVQPAITVTKNSKCFVDASKVTALGDLLEIRPTAGSVTQDLGYVNNGLGTRSNNTCNTANGTFDDGQAMELTLGADLRASNIKIDRARLDLEGKFGTALGYTTFTDAAATSGIDGYRDDLWTGSDNGSDSGPSDNRDVWIGLEDDASDDFVKLSITPVSANDDGRGQIGLEAGGDWGAAASAHYTTLWLVQETADFEYALGCDQTNEFYTETAGADGYSSDLDGPTTPVYPAGATISRYDDGPATGCLPVGANISGSSGDILLRKTTTDADGGEQDPRIRFEIVWVVPTDQITLTNDPFERAVDLDGDSAQFGQEPAQYCDEYAPDPRLDPDGDGVDGLVDPDHAGTAEHPLDPRFDTTTGKLPWCVIADERTPAIVDGVSVILQRVVWDGYGDPKFF